MTDDVRNLLGGYATGTLTEEEKKQLYEAALHDDALFAALADEQALKELLEDGAVRAQLLRATEEPRFTVMAALREWFDRPKSKALVGTGAVLLMVIGFQQTQQLRRGTSEPSTVATNTTELRRPDIQTQPAAPVEAPQSPRKEVTAPPAQRTAESKREQTQAAPESLASGPAAAANESEATVAATAPPPSPPPPQKAAENAKPSVVGSTPSMGAISTLRDAGAPPPAPYAAARKPMPGGAAAGAFQRAAGTSVMPLRYELLRQIGGGDFQGVPPDYVFGPGDVVRLRVSSTRNGVVEISSPDRNQTISGAVVANTWTQVPASGGYAITAATDKLLVRLSPSDGLSGSGLLDSTEARAKRAEPAPVYLEIPIRQKKP